MSDEQIPDEELAKWQAITNAATPGPWVRPQLGDFGRDGNGQTLLQTNYLFNPLIQISIRYPENAAFVEMARTAMPRLLTAVYYEHARAEGALALLAGAQDSADRMAAAHLERCEKVRELQDECDAWIKRYRAALADRDAAVARNGAAEVENAKLRALLKRARFEGELPDELMDEVDAALNVVVE